MKWFWCYSGKEVVDIHRASAFETYEIENEEYPFAVKVLVDGYYYVLDKFQTASEADTYLDKIIKDLEK